MVIKVKIVDDKIFIRKRYKKVTHCPSTTANVVQITRLGMTALYSYSLITVVIGFIPLFKWEKNGC